MAFLTKELLLRKQKLAIEQVDLGNGDFVFVREMTGSERNEWTMLNLVKKEGDLPDLTDIHAKLAVRCMCDEKGVKLFKNDEYKALGDSIGALRLEKISKAVSKINAFTKEAQEDIEKNSDASLPDNSTSDSV